MISSAKERGKRIPESLNSEYSSVCFDCDYFDSKQRALKVYMNTFYGEAGNSKSPIFLRELAGGTTSAGKFNLNLVAEFVTKKGFGIKYGDTDSLYLTCPDKYYEKCNEAFSRKELSKEEYWTEMVEITIDMMKRLRDQVNAYLRIKNGTSYLKMAYEEVLSLVKIDSIRYISGTYISVTNLGHFYISGTRFITSKIHLKIETPDI
jgi:DNA polymerase elongation subunit (family B)